MLKSKAFIKELQENLAVIWASNKKRKQAEKMLEEEYNLLPPTYMEYILGARDLYDLDENILFYLLNAVNDIHPGTFDASKYFSNLEIRKFSNAKYEFVTEEKYPYIIEGVTEVAADQWVTVMNLDVIKDMYDKQLLIYNPNTQRELKKKIRNGEVYYTINICKASVNDIKNDLLSGIFVPNDLSFNLNLDNPDIEYEVDENRIIITNGQLDIIDGFHRFKGAMLAKKENTELQFSFVINIMNFDERKACSFIDQENKRNKISTTYTRSLNANNPTRIIVDRINTSPNSLMRGLIGKEGTNVVSLTDIFELIDITYNTKNMTRSDLLKTANHIVKVINMCIENDEKYLEKMSILELGIIIYGSTINSDEYVCYERIQKAMANRYSIQGKIVKIHKKNIYMIKNLFD